MTNHGCEHIDGIAKVLQPTRRECEECIRTGDRWVHLRTCQECGRTLCCDSSPNRQATRHAQVSGHPVVASAEPGERWLYCYPDDVFIHLLMQDRPRGTQGTDEPTAPVLARGKANGRPTRCSIAGGREKTRMRFMIIVKASKDSEAGRMPSQELLAAMGRYNQELADAGILVSGEGLQPSSKGARVRFAGDRRVVTDGPFPESEQLVAGYWVWQVESREQAIEWVKRCPNPMAGHEAEIEIRPLFEEADFCADLTPEQQAGAEPAAAKH